MSRGGELLFNFSLAAGKMIEEGIMVDILLRLPVKSLIRFKCVCKSWRDLISDPYFAKAHHLSRCMLENPNSQRLLVATILPDSGLKFLCYENTNSEATKVENDLLECPVKFKLPKPAGLCRIVGSCHGLVCLQIWDCTYANRTLVVWNPTTGAFKEIPVPPNSTDNHGFYAFGFGYDSASDDYKVLAYAASRSDELVIFAMKEKYWRSLCILQNRPDGTGVYVNGFLHWLQIYESIGEASCNILSFDLSNEKFEMIPLPAGIDYTCLFDLVEYQGCLLLNTRDSYSEYQKCWIMEGHGSCTKLHDITCQSGDRETTGSVMCYKTDGKVLLHFPRADLLCLYSPKKNEITLFAPLGNPMLHGARFYVESLVSP